MSLHACVAGDGVHAVFDHAEVFKQRGDFPQHPVRHAEHAIDQAHREGDGADGDGIAMPEPDGHGGGARQQHGVDEVERDVHLRGDAHGRVDALQHPAHAFLGIVVFARGVGEKFDRGHVGVGINNAARDHGAHVGLLFRKLAHARHEVAHGEAIEHEPARSAEWPDASHWRRSWPTAEMKNMATQAMTCVSFIITSRTPNGGLHHLGGNAACKFIVEEVHGLAQHVAMCQPADAHGIVAAQALVFDRVCHGGEEGLEQHGEACVEQQFPLVVVPESGAVGRCPACRPSWPT